MTYSGVQRLTRDGVWKYVEKVDRGSLYIQLDMDEAWSIYEWLSSTMPGPFRIISINDGQQVYDYMKEQPLWKLANSH